MTVEIEAAVRDGGGGGQAERVSESCNRSMMNGDEPDQMCEEGE